MEKVIDFCVHLARAVHKGQKTRTYKPLNTREKRLRENGQPVVSDYGQAGDILRVREPAGFSTNGALVYNADYALADGRGAKLSTPDDYSIAPPLTRKQSRSVLTIVSIDIVSLQSVDEAAATAAGTIPTEGRETYLAEFIAQWNEAYPRQTWGSNPDVWKVDFTKNS